MVFESPKFQTETHSESGLTNPLNRGTRQGFKVSADLNPLGWKSALVQKPGKRDCFGPKQCKFEAHNMDFETPKF